MKSHMDHLLLMEMLVAVVDSGSVAGAARKLNLPSPAVSRGVVELERRLGARLLTRTAGAARVTDAGARYAGECRRILLEIDQAFANAAAGRAGPFNL